MTGTGTTSLFVRDVMTRKLVCVSASDTVRDLARIFDADGISGAPVVDGQNRLIGVVSKTDIIRRALEGPLGSQPGSFFELMADGLESSSGRNPEDLGVVEEFMTPDPITALPDERVATVARRMAADKVHRVIIVDAGNHPIGIVTALDLLSVFPK